MVRLGDVCITHAGGTPSRSVSKFWNNGTIPWVKIGDLNGKYLYQTSEKITQAGLDSSSTKLLPKGMILYTIFATLGEVSILNIDATTNQAIVGIEIKNNSVKQDFLYYFLLSTKTNVNNLGRGVAQNNINLSILRDFLIPLPSLAEQKQIASVLDKATGLITLRKQQLEKMDLLIKSKFIEMFGDPITNPMNWKISQLRMLGDLNRGISKHRPRNASQLLGGIYPLIQTGEVANSDIYITEYKSTYSEIGLKQSKMWTKNTLCITIAANIAKTGILSFDACFPDSIVGFIPNNKTNVIFIHYWFSFFQQILESQAPESAQKNINLQILRDLAVITPPIPLQQQFADFVEHVETLKSTLQKSLALLEIQCKALMQKYFEG